MISTVTTVGELVVEQPARARVFERLGLDYCCGGRRPLADACTTKGIDLDIVLHDLELCDAIVAMESEREPEPLWSHAPLADLCDHIEQTHHAFLRSELPRLSTLIGKVVGAHAAHDPRLLTLSTVFTRFRTSLEAHTLKEEMILFPLCRALEQGAPIEAAGLTFPIERMEAEHEEAGDDLARMRALTDDHTAPANACPTYRETLRALAELEADTHKHVHKENHILFPRALALASGRDGQE